MTAREAGEEEEEEVGPGGTAASSSQLRHSPPPPPPRSLFFFSLSQASVALSIVAAPTAAARVQNPASETRPKPSQSFRAGGMTKWSLSPPRVPLSLLPLPPPPPPLPEQNKQSTDAGGGLPTRTKASMASTPASTTPAARRASDPGLPLAAATAK